MKKIIILCYANYCRSPVAESIFRNFNLKKIQFSSRGLIQFDKFHMDPRSQEFLEKAQIPFKSHMPKKINEHDIKNSDLIIAMDYEVVFNFVKKFPYAKSKVKTINYLDPKVNIFDPFNYESTEEYYEQLDKLKNLCHKWEKKLNEL